MTLIQFDAQELLRCFNQVSYTKIHTSQKRYREGILLKCNYKGGLVKLITLSDFTICISELYEATSEASITAILPITLLKRVVGQVKPKSPKISLEVKDGRATFSNKEFVETALLIPGRFKFTYIDEVYGSYDSFLYRFSITSAIKKDIIIYLKKHTLKIDSRQAVWFCCDGSLLKLVVVNNPNSLVAVKEFECMYIDRGGAKDSQATSYKIDINFLIEALEKLDKKPIIEIPPEQALLVLRAANLTIGVCPFYITGYRFNLSNNTISERKFTYQESAEF